MVDEDSITSDPAAKYELAPHAMGRHNAPCVTSSPSPPPTDRNSAEPRRSITRRNALLGVGTVGAGIMLDSTDYLSTFGGSASGPRLERIRNSPNFRNGVFQNPVDTTVMAPGRMIDSARQWLTATNVRPPAALPTLEPARDSFTAPGDGLHVCWLGHSSVLLEVEGIRLLFDPVWATRSSPSRLVGPHRFQPNPLRLNQVPELSAVVISHDHYDHLDKRTIQHLATSQPSLPFAVPLGVGAHLEKWGVNAERILELDWNEERSLGHVRLVSLPARHFSGRGLFDRNSTQWASWAVIGRSHRVFFSGDTGFHPLFQDYARKLGPFDLTMLEIGAFHPNWGTIHLGPENALKAHLALAGRHLLPIHWGAFNLALHPWDEPINTLTSLSEKSGSKLLVPRPGERVELGSEPSMPQWWNTLQA